MSDVYRTVKGEPASGLLLVADHASNRVPEDVDLGIGADLLGKHIAVDLGVDALAAELLPLVGAPAVLANISRLVVDLHREADHPDAIPIESDGHVIPGNARLSDAERGARIERFWEPYHAAVSEHVDRHRPDLLFTLHSFTPKLESNPDEHRPWDKGILYNEDDRAPRIAIPKLRALGLEVGDNQPYSGKVLNATMNLHAEARGIPYLAIEVRNDLIADAKGARKWAEILAPVITETRDALKGEGSDG